MQLCLSHCCIWPSPKTWSRLKGGLALPLSPSHPYNGPVQNPRWKVWKLPLMHSVGAAVDGQGAKHQIAGAHLCKLDQQSVGVEHCSCIICTGYCGLRVLDSTAWPAK